MLTPPGRLHMRQLLQFTGLPAPMEITYGVQCDDLTTPTDAFDVATGCFQAFIDNLLVGMSDQVTASGLIYSGELDDATEVSGLVSGSSVGSDTDDIPPPNVAVLIRKLTGLGGRRNRGRFYLPCYIDESAVSDRGTIAGASITALNNDSNAMLQDIAAITTTNVTDTKMVILHSTGASTPTPEVLGLEAQSIVATQRRRLQRS